MLGGELRNGLPESAQGFLSFGEVEYYDALSRANNVLLNFAGNILKTSGLNFCTSFISVSLKAPSRPAFGVQCAK